MLGLAAILLYQFYFLVLPLRLAAQPAPLQLAGWLRHGISSPKTTPIAAAPPNKPAPPPASPTVSARSIAGWPLYRWPSSSAVQALSQLAPGSSEYSLIKKIADQPQAVWIGGWTGDPAQSVRQIATQASAQRTLPVFVLYNLPGLDCGSYSAGGAADAAAYSRWLDQVNAGLGALPAAVIIEPDALAELDCWPADLQASNLALIRRAVGLFAAKPNVYTYVDAGNARWQSEATMAQRLAAVDVPRASGFALNISNYLSDAESAAYGQRLSQLTGGKHFIVDSSRNGNGPAADGGWCNPGGRALGRPPTTATGQSLVDAWLWIKAPGESDGECNGGPAAGAWWLDYALGLASLAHF